MLNILIISGDDTCRSRLAEGLFNSFGRGMKVSTAGAADGGAVSEVLRRFIDENGLDASLRPAVLAEACTDRNWDVVVTLCPEAEQARRQLHLESSLHASFHFTDPLQSRAAGTDEQMDRLMEAYEAIHRELYRFYRDELSELLMPRCTCGANTYCRCE